MRQPRNHDDDDDDDDIGKSQEVWGGVLVQTHHEYCAAWTRKPVTPSMAPLPGPPFFSMEYVDPNSMKSPTRNINQPVFLRPRNQSQEVSRSSTQAHATC